MEQQNDTQSAEGLSFWRKHGGKLLVGSGGLILLLILIQLVPANRTNPATKAEPNWDSSQTRELAAVACFDCHSNETDWSPWYTKVAPMKFLVAHDVEEGRSELNFSEWPPSDEESGELAEEIAEVINEGEMPPRQYTLMHSDAALSDDEKQQLIEGFMRTLAQSPSGSENSNHNSDDDD